MSPKSPVQIPELVYGRVAYEQLLIPCTKEIKRIFSNKKLSDDEKLASIIFEVLFLRQPIIRLIKDKENLSWSTANSVPARQLESSLKKYL